MFVSAELLAEFARAGGTRYEIARYVAVIAPRDSWRRLYFTDAARLAKPREKEALEVEFAEEIHICSGARSRGG